MYGLKKNTDLKQLSQPRQPLPRILHLSNTRVRILPEVEESLVVLDGFGCVALLFVDLSAHINGFCV